MPIARTCIIILNWRGAQDTCACIAALRNTITSPYGLVVVDNASGDDSVETLTACLRQQYGACSVHYLDQKTVGSAVGFTAASDEPTLIINDHNAGYAGGNNLGLQLAYAAGYDFCWILNNDSEVITDTLLFMEKAFQNERVGFVGAVVQKSTGETECWGGGVFYPWLGRARLLTNAAAFEHVDQYQFLMGSSLMVSRAVLERVGFMDEDYFMYWEEVDWQYRAKQAGYNLLVAPEMVIVHKSGERPRGRAFFYFRTRAGVMFVKRFFGKIPAVSAFLFVLLTEFLQNWRDVQALRWIASGAWDGLRGNGNVGKHPENTAEGTAA